jgi:hypothetical protein
VEPTVILLRQPAHLNRTQRAVLRTATTKVTNQKWFVTFVFGSAFDWRIPVPAESCEAGSLNRRGSRCVAAYARRISDRLYGHDAPACQPWHELSFRLG